MLKRTISVFLAGIAWYAALIPWDRFGDPDAFYHAKMALLIWNHGPVRAFPWLDLTTLGTAFADHHFFFHLIEAPFVASFGWANGARVTGILLAAIFLVVFDRCIRSLKIRYATAWTALIAFTSPLAMRLVLGKASPLAVSLFILGTMLSWKRKPFFVFAVSVVLALSYGGWVYLPGALAFLCLGDILHRHVVDFQPWRTSIGQSIWKEGLLAFAGGVVGTVLHPNFPANISFLWIQIVKIGLLTSYGHVILGREWLPESLFDLIASCAPWFIALILGMTGLFLAARKPIDREAARAVTSFAWPVAAFVALTLKSQRNIEYLAPLLALWIPMMWSMIDLAAFRRLFGFGWSLMRRRVVFGIVGTLLLVTVAKGVWDAGSALRKNAFPDNSYQEAMAPVSAKAQAGDRVFHSDWDEFPMLFNIDDRLRYVAGLDPTFLYEASSSLSDAYRDLTWHTASATPEQAWDLVHERLDAKFVFVARRDHQPLADLFEADARYHLLAKTDDAETFEVQP